MPYIAEEDRPELDDSLREIRGVASNLSEGELNYVLTSIILSWVGSPVSYSSINAAVGVLECAKLELYRRVASPYEDMKRDLNGEVYV